MTTTLDRSSAIAPAAGLGWCTVCAGEGRFVVAADPCVGSTCAMHLQAPAMAFVPGPRDPLDQLLVDFPLVQAATAADYVPLYVTGERAWCERCERAGRRRLGLTRAPGLVACGRCLRAHERTGLDYDAVVKQLIDRQIDAK